MEEHFAEFIGRIRAACGTITAEYFQLPIAAGDAVYRERVYCYELYHCLRQDWGHFPFSLGGEIDKSGHPLFRGGPYALAKPDFLAHQPGSMDANLACVEVKSSMQAIAALVADLRKLGWFRDEARYFGGILLIFGENQIAIKDLGLEIRAAAEAANLDLANIVLLHHTAAGTEALIL
jgi:hypothetical protein